MTAEEVTRTLGGRWTGTSGLVRCVAHDDSNPSLSVGQGRDGRVLAKCFGGCSQASVLDALRGLGITLDGETNAYRAPIARKPIMRPEAPTRPTERRVIEKVYPYTDECGELLYEIVRFKPKSFVQRYPDGRGGQVWRKHERQVLYNLPTVLRSQICMVTEGERDADALVERGFVATTNAGGANAPWLPEFTDALRGREVVLVPDMDPPGFARVKTIAAALLGNVRRLRVLTLPDGFKDVAEFFEAGHSETAFLALLEDADGSL